MQHSEFVQALKVREIEVDVDGSKAVQIAGAKILPRRYRFVHLFWACAWILSVPAAFAAIYSYTWWVGLFILLVLTPLLSQIMKISAMQLMINCAVQYPQFYWLAVDEHVIRIRRKT